MKKRINVFVIMIIAICLISIMSKMTKADEGLSVVESDGDNYNSEIVNNYPILELDVPYVIGSSDKDVWLRFTPTETRNYKFYSKDISGDNDPYIALIDSKDLEGCIANDDNSGIGLEFSLTYELEKGKTYCLRLENYGDGGTYAVYAEKAPVVTGIEIVSGKVEQLTENIDGYWNEDSDGEAYFRYTYREALGNIKFQIKYSDGTSVITKHTTVDGEYIAYSDSQANNHWTVGNNNFITFTYKGVSVKAPVTIIENPVKDISFIKNPNVTYIWGDNEYGNTNGNYYNFAPYNLSGMELLVEYKDGTSKIFTDKDIVIHEVGYESIRKLNGYNFTAGWMDIEDAGTYKATFRYMGHDIEYDIKVVESPISSIRVVKAPDKTTQVYYPDFLGMQIELLYKDGTRKIVIVTERNLKCYSSQGYWCEVKEGDIAIDIDVIPKSYCTISAFGKECEYNGMKYKEAKKIEEIEVSNISLEAKGMILYLKYSDGTTKEIKVDPIYSYRPNETWSLGLIRTDEGNIRYDIYAYDKNDDGNIDKYVMEIMGEKITVKVRENNTPTVKEPITTKKEVHVAKTKIKSATKKRKAKKAKISLKKVKGVTGYQIKISTSKKFPKKKTITKNSKKNVVTIKKLKAKKKYFVKARCYKVVNDKKYYGVWTKVKKVKN